MEKVTTILETLTSTIKEILYDEPSTSKTSQPSTKKIKRIETDVSSSSVGSYSRDSVGGKISKSGRRQRICPYCSKSYYNVTNHFQWHHQGEGLPKEALFYDSKAQVRKERKIQIIHWVHMLYL
ncbi:uncharacterized protein LOC144749347 [Ciona intestinalis]